MVLWHGKVMTFGIKINEYQAFRLCAARGFIKIAFADRWRCALIVHFVIMFFICENRAVYYFTRISRVIIE